MAPAAGKNPSSATRSQPPALKCPRCDSPNTKFCYYNNYSLSQPRHFCKTCRRYWTKGGAMRSVPIGGGCRKNKKAKSSSGDSVDSNGSSSDIGGLKFFQGIPPAMDFQLGGISAPFPRIPNTALFNQFSSGSGILSNTSCAIPSSPCYSFDPSAMGFNFPFPKQGNNIPNPFHEIGSSNLQNNLTSSIESLSSINQDLHWKLQKQRLSMLLAGDHNQRMNINLIEPNVEKPQPIPFQNLEIAKADQSCGIKTAAGKDGGIGNGNGNGNGNENLSTEWFFDNCYGNMNQGEATSGNNVDHENGGSWSGIQAWSDLSQY